MLKARNDIPMEPRDATRIHRIFHHAVVLSLKGTSCGLLERVSQASTASTSRPTRAPSRPPATAQCSSAESVPDSIATDNAQRNTQTWAFELFNAQRQEAYGMRSCSVFARIDRRSTPEVQRFKADLSAN